jgi:hypothetical protein
MKLLRTIRLDPSDQLVFARAAEPGEWAVSGGFMFWDHDSAAMTGKERVAFRSGLLGVASGGWSTLVAVAEATEADLAEATEQLAQWIHRELGAPSLDAARESARGELAAAAELAEHPVNTLIAVHRSMDPSGEIIEQFRTITARPPEQREGALRYGPAFTLVATDDDSPQEQVDLVAVMKNSPQ